MSYVKSILRVDEVIAYRAKRHWIIFFRPVLIAFLALIFCFYMIQKYGSLGFPSVFIFLFFLLPLLFTFLDYKTSEFVVTSQRVLGKVGFISRNSIELQLSRVEGIRVHQSIPGRILGYGTIVTGSAGASSLFPLIRNPMQVRRSVDEQLVALEAKEQKIR